MCQPDDGSSVMGELPRKETTESSRTLSSELYMPTVAQARLHYTGTNTKLVTRLFKQWNEVTS